MPDPLSSNKILHPSLFVKISMSNLSEYRIELSIIFWNALFNCKGLPDVWTTFFSCKFILNFSLLTLLIIYFKNLFKFIFSIGSGASDLTKLT